MTDVQVHLHRAQGVVLLTAAHVSPADHRKGLESLTLFRWRDEAGVEGQDSTARLVNYLADHPNMIAIEVDGERIPVEANPNGRMLQTSGAQANSDPLLALPHFSGHGA